MSQISLIRINYYYYKCLHNEKLAIRDHVCCADIAIAIFLEVMPLHSMENFLSLLVFHISGQLDILRNHVTHYLPLNIILTNFIYLSCPLLRKHYYATDRLFQ
jgi:hypothetical protein